METERDLLPTGSVWQETDAGALTEEGAKLLDVSGNSAARAVWYARRKVTQEPVWQRLTA